MKIRLTMDWKEIEPAILGYLSDALKREITPEQLTSFAIEYSDGQTDKVIADVSIESSEGQQDQ